MSRMSLEDARMVLRNRGYQPMPTGKSEWVVSKDNKTVAGPFTGRDLVKYAKKILDDKIESKNYYNRVREDSKREMMAEMRANFEPGTTVVNVLTGERTRI